MVIELKLSKQASKSRIKKSSSFLPSLSSLSFSPSPFFCFFSCFTEEVFRCRTKRLDAKKEEIQREEEVLFCLSSLLVCFFLSLLSRLSLVNFKTVHLLSLSLFISFSFSLLSTLSSLLLLTYTLFFVLLSLRNSHFSCFQAFVLIIRKEALFGLCQQGEKERRCMQEKTGSAEEKRKNNTRKMERSEEDNKISGEREVEFSL